MYKNTNNIESWRKLYADIYRIDIYTPYKCEYEFIILLKYFLVHYNLKFISIGLAFKILIKTISSYCTTLFKELFMLQNKTFDVYMRDSEIGNYTERDFKSYIKQNKLTTLRIPKNVTGGKNTKKRS